MNRPVHFNEQVHVDPRLPVHSTRNQSKVERARTLAIGLRTFQPKRNLPRPLWETAYLLEQCWNVDWSLLERLRIIGLMANSLDQFFIKGSFQNEARGTIESTDWIAELPLFIEETLQRASTYLSETLLPALAQSHHIEICSAETLGPEEHQWLRQLFQMRVYPLLTPLAIDPGHPFPFISTFSLNFLVQLRPGQSEKPWDSPNYARIKVPRLLPRFIGLPYDEDHGEEPNDSNVKRYIQSEEVVRFFLPELFPGLTVENAFLFRVVRAVEDRPSKDEPIEQGARQRELGLPVVRLDVEEAIPAPLLDWLVTHLDVPPDACFRLPNQIGGLQLVDLANLIEGTTAVVGQPRT